MFEYKSTDNLFSDRNYSDQFIFIKLDVDTELIDNLPNQNEQFLNDEQHLILGNLITRIQDADSKKNENDIETLISQLNIYLNCQELSSLPLDQISNIIPVLINQLHRENDFDKLKLYSIQCLHKLIYNFIEIENFALENKITDPLFKILKPPISPITENALCILINIFSDHNEFIPYLIDYFNPKKILKLFTETKYEIGFARLVAFKTRERIKNMVCKLFLQYSTIQLNDEYFQIILNFYDSIFFQKNEEEERFYLLILQAFHGMYVLFTRNRIDFEYLKRKPVDLFNTILNTLNFCQKLNTFDVVPEIIESFKSLIYFASNLIINYYSNTNIDSSSIIETLAQKDFEQFKSNPFNFFILLIEKKCIFNSDQIFFENAIINFLCNSIVNDSFMMACPAFSILSYIVKIISSKNIHLILNENVFQSLFKIIQSNNQNYMIESISDFLILSAKSQNYGQAQAFSELLLRNDADIGEIIESDFDLIPTEIMNQFIQMINSLGNNS